MLQVCKIELSLIIMVEQKAIFLPVIFSSRILLFTLTLFCHADVLRSLLLKPFPRSISHNLISCRGIQVNQVPRQFLDWILFAYKADLP